MYDDFIMEDLKEEESIRADNEAANSEDYWYNKYIPLEKKYVSLVDKHRVLKEEYEELKKENGKLREYYKDLKKENDKLKVMIFDAAIMMMEEEEDGRQD